MSLSVVVLGAIAVFAFVLVSLMVQGRRAARSRQSQRGNLGLVRVAIPDPVLTAGILSAFQASEGVGDYTLAGLERVTSGQPGVWYVAMLKGTPTAAATPDAAPGAAAAVRVVLVIDGLPSPSGSAAAGERALIPGSDSVWTQRWASGLLIVEGAPDAGDAVRDLERMKEAGAAAAAQYLPPSQNLHRKRQP